MEKSRLLSEEQVAGMLGVGVRTLDKLIEDGRFPGKILVSDRNGGWLVKDVKAYLYIRSRIGDRNEKLPKNPSAQ